MPNFTSVIRKSVGRSASADDPAKRAEVYDHVYAVMVAQLEQQLPPLSNAELADRIALFEASVREVEAEYAPLAWQDDDRIDEAGADSPEPSADGPAESNPYVADADDAVWDSPAIDMTWDAEHSAWRDAARPRAEPDDAGLAEADGPIPGDWNSRISAAVSGDPPPPVSPPRPGPYLLLGGPEAPPAKRSLFARVRAFAPSARRAADDRPLAPPAAVATPNAPPVSDAEDRPEPLAAAAAEMPEAPPHPRRTDRILLIAGAAFAVVAAAYSASVFVPLFFGGDETPVIAETPVVAEVPTLAPAPSRTFDPAPEVLLEDIPAVEVPAVPRDVRTVLPFDPAAAPVAETAAIESIILFNGENPTVFEAVSDNPVRFRGETGAGIARIGSTASSAGVRAVVGPGLVQRLLGHRARMLVEIRAAPENPATSIRFAFQHGRALSDWQQAALPAEFGTVALEFDVPADEQARGNDYLIIEPGIPGDGNAADIRFIRIEVMP